MAPSARLGLVQCWTTDFSAGPFRSHDKFVERAVAETDVQR